MVAGTVKLLLVDGDDLLLVEGGSLLLVDTADFDPANLAATVDGDTVSLSWDASPLVPA